MSLLDLAQMYTFRRVLECGRDASGVWELPFDLWLWARGENGGYPNLTMLTWPG